jgi:hypothetical protein
LSANPEAEQTIVYVFSDGPRSEADREAVHATREVLQQSGLRHMRVIIRERNMGLAANVIDGVTYVCQKHGRVIVLEDDLVLSPTYLEFMNAALDRYANDENVFHVSGYMFPVRIRARHHAVLLPLATCSGGWATWERAWCDFDPTCRGYSALRADRALRKRFDLDGRYIFFHILEQQQAGRVDSWAIRWYLSIFMKNGLGVFPAKSLAQNTGFGADATHCNLSEVPEALRAVAHPFHVTSFPEPKLDSGALRKVSRFLGREFGLRARILGKVRGAYRLLARLASRSARGPRSSQ